MTFVCVLFDPASYKLHDPPLSLPSFFLTTPHLTPVVEASSLDLSATQFATSD